MDLVVSRTGVACTETGPCVELTLLNSGQSAVEIPIGESGAIPRPHPLYSGCEHRLPDGEWKVLVTEIGTYLAPSENLRIRPGESGRFMAFDCNPGQSAYRYFLRDTRGDLHVTEARVP